MQIFLYLPFASVLAVARKYFLALIAALLSVLACPVDSIAANQTNIKTVIVADLYPFPTWEAALEAKNRASELINPNLLNALTLAYAVEELRTHLEGIGFQVSVATTQPQNGFDQDPHIIKFANATETEAQKSSRTVLDQSEWHSVSTRKKTTTITAAGRIGALYGAYSFLEELGFDWPHPGALIVPSLDSTLKKIAMERESRWQPTQEFRGFWIYEPARVDAEFLSWMARKKFNLGPISLPQQRRMLGIRGWGGGHYLIEEEFSKPGLFEQHPDWFSRIRLFKRPVERKDSLVNPAFASQAAAEYFADQLAKRLEFGDLRHVDVLNVWQADSAGRAFDESWRARALGNESDNLLYFYANVVERLVAHQKAGTLRQNFLFAGASYQQTMIAPTNILNAVRLSKLPYLHLFYPINRDWSSLAKVPPSPLNEKILQQVANWKVSVPLRYGVVDYHNMSIFGGLALSDFQNFFDNLEVFSSGGLDLFAYMHMVAGDPGPRRLMHSLASRLGWSDGSDQKSAAQVVISQYFDRRFGIHAEAMRGAYEQVALALENVNEIFAFDSLHFLLVQDLVWAEPVYPSAEVKNFVSSFAEGGKQLRPGKFYGNRDYEHEFIGTGDSIARIEKAIQITKSEIGRSHNSKLTQSMQIDLTWFETSLKRYSAIQHLSSAVLAEPGGFARKRELIALANDLSYLEKSGILDGALSPLDQKSFIRQYRDLIRVLE